MMEEQDRTAANEEALRIQAANGDLAAVQSLVNDQNVKASACDDSGTCALIASAECGQTSVLKYLIEDCGLDPSATDNGGWSAMHVAAAGGFNDTLQMLVWLGANPRPLTRDGRSCLFVATASNRVSTCRLLLDKFRENLNLTTNDGWSCLYIAALFGHQDVFQLLVDRGADCRLRAYGERIVTVAKRRGHTEMVRTLEAIDEMKQLAFTDDIESIRRGIKAGDEVCLAPVAQWFHLLTPVSSFDLSKWAVSCLNDASLCYCALFSPLGDNESANYFRDNIAHDGNKHIQVEIISYLVHPQKNTRRILRQIVEACTGLVDSVCDEPHMR